MRIDIAILHFPLRGSTLMRTVVVVMGVERRRISAHDGALQMAPLQWRSAAAKAPKQVVQLVYYT